MRNDWKTLAAAALLTACAVLIQLSEGWRIEWAADVTLVALLSAAMFLSASETLFLSAAASAVMNWKPSASIELLLLITLPLAVSVMRKRWPFRPLAATVICALAAPLVFRGVVERGAFLTAGVSQFPAIMVFNVAVACMAFWVLHAVYEEKTSSL
jgi:hypothetical protein